MVYPRHSIISYLAFIEVLIDTCLMIYCVIVGCVALCVLYVHVFNLPQQRHRPIYFAKIKISPDDVPQSAAWLKNLSLVCSGGTYPHNITSPEFKKGACDFWSQPNMSPSDVIHPTAPMRGVFLATNL